jgi:hypothetical protein
MMNNLEARGVEPLFPAAMSSNVHGCFQRNMVSRSDTNDQSHFRGEYLFMEERGRTWMLLVLLLGDKRLETCGSAILDRLFS